LILIGFVLFGDLRASSRNCDRDDIAGILKAYANFAVDPDRFKIWVGYETVTIRDRNTGKVTSETFFGDSPFGK